MSNRKSSTTEAPSQEAPKKKGPYKTLRKDDCWGNIHRFEGNPSGAYFSVGFNRSYRTKTGEWRSTQFFGVDDLGKLIALAKEAHEFILSEQKESA